MKTIRGAITVENNDEREIETAVKELLTEILSKNKIKIPQIQFAVFTCTADITAAYPAKYAREMGFSAVPMMCAQEMRVIGSMPMCIRVLITVDADFTPKHIYLKNAINLRKDLI